MGRGVRRMIGSVENYMIRSNLVRTVRFLIFYCFCFVRRAPPARAGRRLGTLKLTSTSDLQT